MTGITISEVHPLHGRSNCQYCNGKGRVESCNNGPIAGCPVCSGRGWLYVHAFDGRCNKCRAERYAHDYHTKIGILTHD